MTSAAAAVACSSSVADLTQYRVCLDRAKPPPLGSVTSIELLPSRVDRDYVGFGMTFRFAFLGLKFLLYPSVDKGKELTRVAILLIISMPANDNFIQSSCCCSHQ
jgi:hypothetical protein